MAEALSVFGATASALRLSQGICKAAKQLYSFFYAIKHSLQEIEDLRNSLEDMGDVADMFNALRPLSKAGRGL